MGEPAFTFDILAALRSLTRVLVIAVGVIFLAGVVLLTAAWHHQTSKETDLASCRARAMEGKIEHERTETFLDLCMRGNGYFLSKECVLESYRTKFCYFPTWMGWAD